jgi:4a-hydroxytetrahydrobiopterin dehydratase
VQEQLAALEGWELLAGNAAISKTFRFVNFYETMAL